MRTDTLAERHVDVEGQDVQPTGTTQGPDELTRHIESLKATRAEKWQSEAFEKAGPMAVWDAVAGRLERLVERLEASGKGVRTL